MEKSEQPAFPVVAPDYEGLMPRLTKREYCAAKAMQGFLANPSESDVSSLHVLNSLGLPDGTPYSFENHWLKYVAKRAVAYSDALLSELK